MTRREVVPERWRKRTVRIPGFWTANAATSVRRTIMSRSDALMTEGL
jgi:hypothetical protein